jgi:hypothetical protein
VSGETFDGRQCPKDASERPDHPQKPNETKQSERTSRRNQREGVDPVAPQITPAVVRRYEARNELSEEDNRQTDIGRVEKPLLVWGRRVDKTDDHEQDRKGGHDELPSDLVLVDPHVVSVAEFSQPGPHCLGVTSQTRSVPDNTTVEGLISVSWGPERIDLFWIGPDRQLMHRGWINGGWLPDEDLGGQLSAPPAVTSWAENEMEVFAVFADGQLYNRYWDGSAWHEWESLGGELVGQPATSSWGADRIDVFAPGRDGSLWHRWWNGTEWVPWRQEHGPELVADA